jgi:putative ABC transport system ATP-binding protein
MELSDCIIELTDACKTYGTDQAQVRALQKVSLQIRRGEFSCVWGPSGSGKSTLLNLIGLLDTPDAGAVHIAGTDCATLDKASAARFRNEKIGFVFQSFNLVPVLSALENVMLPLQIAKKSPAEAKQLALAALADVGLSEQVHKHPDQMSGGQRQRVAIARALVNGPQLVLADEPTANLDSVTAESIIELLRRLNVQKHVTFLFSTHDPRLLDYANRLIELKDGRIASDHPQTNLKVA